MAFQLMNDPETIATLEESSDLKYLTVDDYESMKREIEKKHDELKINTETIATLEESSDLKYLTVDDYESMKREIEKKHDELNGMGQVLWDLCLAGEDQL
eukprot:CAMPEP_0181138020 /NCGR_PEP_ID=MMETSP1071-20121207/34019_1 /TAXON_ID=35127 /ORGANISM="Thalassiosira sp., Strain NH16" /LENGTH=99 /DNA_ID=CAMNT_0023224819 /DNA_START=69 /DNA_END=368 /DNA_ORIENTATION=+